MAKWGYSSWGYSFPWGFGGPTGDTWACNLAKSRVLVQHADDGFNTATQMDLHDYVCVMAEQAGHYVDVCNDVIGAFDLATADGVQLDIIGAIVGLPRSGQPDSTYRVWLGIQIDLLISARPEDPNWIGTVNNILSICRRFIGTGVLDPIVLHNSWPYSYSLTVPGITDFTTLKTLVRFIRKATWAGVLGQILFLIGDKTYCYTLLADTATAGPYCYVTAADTPNAALYAHVVLIGDGPC